MLRSNQESVHQTTCLSLPEYNPENSESFYHAVRSYRSIPPQTAPKSSIEAFIQAWHQNRHDVIKKHADLIVLYALSTEPNQWSDDFKETLQLMTEWLLTNQSQDNQLQQLKKSYPPFLISNLLFIALIMRSNAAEDIKRQLIGKIDHLSELGNTSLLTQRHDTNKVVLLKIIGNKLSMLINDGDQLVYFLHPRVLQNEQRYLLWNNVKDRLDSLIQNDDQRIQLFMLFLFEESALKSQCQSHSMWWSAENDNKQRAEQDQILKNVKKKLGTLIENNEQLMKLLTFMVSNQTLSETQCTSILIAVKDQLAQWIHDGDQLTRLLTLTSKDQRDLILTAVKDQLAQWIHDGDQLANLLSIRPLSLSPAQYNSIFDTMQDKLGILIKDGLQLQSLLGLKRLSETQRTLILTAVHDRLGEWIQDVDQLHLLFLHAKELSKKQCDLIFEKINLHQLLLQNGSGGFQRLLGVVNLGVVAALSPIQLASILEKLKADCAGEKLLNESIKDGYQLRALLQSTTYRDLILTVVQNKLGAFIQNDYQLEALLMLEPPLSEKHRAMISEAKNKPGMMI